jgi:thioredoxin 1
LTVLEKTYAGKVKFVKVNVDDEKELEERFQIMTLPTLMFFKDGKASDGLVNPASKTVITGWLAEKGIE